MKLIRWGAKGAEKPGLVDSAGNLRDLSGLVAEITPDLLSPEGLKHLSGIAAAVESSLFGGQAIEAARFKACRDAYAAFAAQEAQRCLSYGKTSEFRSSHISSREPASGRRRGCAASARRP